MIVLKNCFYLHSPEVDDRRGGWDILLSGGRIASISRDISPPSGHRSIHCLVYHYEIWKRLDEPSVRSSTLLACAELLLTGCTATTDHHCLYPRGLEVDVARPKRGRAAARLGRAG